MVEKAKIRLEKKAKLNKINRVIIMSLACLLLEVGFYFFLMPSNLVTGGLMGIAVIFDGVISPSIIRYGLNVIFLIFGLIFLGKDFFLKTIYLSLFAPLFTLVMHDIFNVPYDLIISGITESKLLISSVMAGLLVGAGLGLVLRYGGSTGGVDIPQKIISKYTKISFTKAMYLIDGLIILIGFIIYIRDNQIDHFLMAVLSMIISGIIIDRISIAGRSGYTYFIISDYSDAIKLSILNKMERGVTIVDGVGAFTNKPVNMLICNILKKEKVSMDEYINLIDSKAFVFIVESKEVFGYGFSKNQDHFMDKMLSEIQYKKDLEASILKQEEYEENNQDS
jgi:uncharacterized membrane-anchored protein YitT (DUF2179 family)